MVISNMLNFKNNPEIESTLKCIRLKTFTLLILLSHSIFALMDELRHWQDLLKIAEAHCCYDIAISPRCSSKCEL